MVGLLLTFLVPTLVILPVWFFVRIKTLGEENDAFRRRIADLESGLAQLRTKLSAPTPPVAPAAPLTPAPTPASLPAAKAEPPLPATTTPPPVIVRHAVAPPASVVGQPTAPVAPPSRPVAAPPPTPSRPAYQPPPPKPAIDWEQFMGAKLFAWLGGFAAFLAIGFFVKYSFEHDLIPPEVRVSLGFLLSAGLIVGGLKIPAQRFRITAQVLCATGVVSLYAVTFACNAVYHFAFFGQTATFLLMTLITAAAFLLAVRMDAQVVALLGLLGGFLTPVLLSTGQDNPGGLFGFVALLDAGLIAVALHRRWFYLVTLGVVGTVFMQIGWAVSFFRAEKAPIAITVCLSFCALLFAAVEVARRYKRSSAHVTWSAATLAFVALGFALFFLEYRSIGARPGLWFSFVFAADLFLLALAWREQGAALLPLIAGTVVFGELGLWTAASLTEPLLPWALAAYLVFAGLHTAFPLVLERLRPGAVAATWWNQCFPPLALLLMLGPLLKFDAVSLLFWPAVLLVDLIAVGLALISASLIALGVVLVLTLAATGLCLSHASALTTSPWPLLLVIGGFSVFFFAAGLFLARRLGGKLIANHGAGAGPTLVLGDARAQIPAFSALLPFVLLVMMSQRLNLPDPSPLFGLALLLCVLVLGLTRLLDIEWLPVCALTGVAALEYAWHARRLTAPGDATPLWWYLGFYLLFAIFPFAYRRRFAARTGPWAVAALSGVAQFSLVYWNVRTHWPNDFPGVLPALFSVVPLASLVVILRSPAVDPAKRLNQLAWFGGTALFFITLVFPIQFERQWITIGWALEGAALLWLFHRVPHPGLRATGVVLLAIAFTRLALNREVISYHVRSDLPIFNWYFYAYGIVTAALFVGAYLTAPPRDRVVGVAAPPFLNALGTILAFLLLNIEIADYFSATGSTLTFQFSGSFARDMAYTIGWALFALIVLGAGIWRQARPARYAALGLLSVTLLKLFFHDLAQLDQLYRVGALIAVAAVAILASFLYQRFIPSDDRTPPAQP